MSGGPPLALLRATTSLVRATRARAVFYSVGPLSPGSRMRRISLIGIPPCRTNSLWNVSSLKSCPFALR